MSSRLRGPAFARARRIARHVAENNVERPIVRTLKVRSMLDGSRPTLVHVGDSSLLHISEHDSDLRRLGEMLADEVGTRSAQFFGPGYNAALFAEMTRLVSNRSAPVCVIVSIGLRTSTHRHVTRHPKWGYQRSVAALRQARTVDARLLAKTLRRSPAESEYAAYESITRSSRWNLADTIGEYRRGLRGYNPLNETTERQTLLFDYFHGERTEGSSGLDDWHTFGQRLRAWGVPVVAYRSWMPTQRGTTLLGPSFTEHVEQNFGLIEDSFFEGLGRSDRTAIDPPADELFVNPADGTEHLNERGRRAVVEALAPSVREALA